MNGQIEIYGCDVQAFIIVVQHHIHLNGARGQLIMMIIMHHEIISKDWKGHRERKKYDFENLLRAAKRAISQAKKCYMQTSLSLSLLLKELKNIHAPVIKYDE